MTTVLTPIETVPQLQHAEAVVLAAEENARFVALVEDLADEDWSRPTDCTAWDVRELVLHVLGAMQGQVSPRQFVHQSRAGAKVAGERPLVDGMTEVQVRERLHLQPAEIVSALSAVGPKAARSRARLPGLLRRVRMKVDVDGVMEPWTLGYLMDVIFTRDTWMHRVDLSRATGHTLELDAHDARIVADVVREWAQRHGQPFVLRLQGPAGGAFTAGEGGEEITMDAVEFCRTLSGRAPGSGLLTQAVPF